VVGFFVQRRFINPAARNWVAARMVRLRPPARHRRLPEDALRASQAPATSGIAMLSELLSPAVCKELRRYFSQREVYDCMTYTGREARASCPAARSATPTLTLRTTRHKMCCVRRTCWRWPTIRAFLRSSAAL
jgi:hypothetical protein